MSEERSAAIHRLLGAAHIFSATVDGVLEKALSQATDEDLGLSQVKLMMLIAQAEQPFKVTDVADYMGVTNAAASRSIERLVQRGLVNRTVSRVDRRAVELTLTAASQEILEGFAEARTRELVTRLAGFPTERLEALSTALDELSVVLLGLHAAAERKCMSCRMHFREGCVLRDVVGQECVVSTALYGAGESSG